MTSCQARSPKGPWTTTSNTSVPITPQVVLTGVRQVYRDREGRPTSQGMPSYVWREEGGVWYIVAGQNAAVDVP